MATVAPKRARLKRGRDAHGEQLSLLDAPAPRAETADTDERAGLPARPSRADRAPTPRRATAESLAARQREISVSEFFTKNRHLLGFDSAAKALLTTVKEAVDNSLDACEEAGILPEIRVEIVELSESRHRVVVQDNGPGIVKAQIPRVFGKLLYGSKFHRLRQSRGQQGIGISAAAMYGQLTTGKPVVITSKTGKGRAAHHFEIVIDTAKNTPRAVKDETLEWEPDHGTRVEIELEATYKAGRRSVDEYLDLVAIANPHATIRYRPPARRATKDRPAQEREPVRHERVSEELPREPKEIKPHPYGVELGFLAQILKETRAHTVRGALAEEFCRVSPGVADEIARVAQVRAEANPRKLHPADVERLHAAIPRVRIIAPPTSCVVPIGEELLRKGLAREIRADLYATCTRPPSVYRGNPFCVEAGLAWGGDLLGDADDEDDDAGPREGDAPARLMRFANRAPLQHQPSACAIFRAVAETNWRQYGLSQPRGSLPLAPVVLIVHIASVWVPFTSESKEAVAHYPEITKEVKLALREVGRRLAAFLRQRAHQAHEARRRSIFDLYIPELASALEKIAEAKRAKTEAALHEMAARFTGAEEE